MSRTKRRPYTKSRAVDSSCRCHGSCSYCQNNRMHKNNKRKQKAEDSLKYWKNNEES